MKGGLRKNRGIFTNRLLAFGSWLLAPSPGINSLQAASQMRADERSKAKPLAQMQHPQHITGNLMKDRFILFPEGGGLRIWARRPVGSHTFAGQHLLDPKDMVGIAHGQAGFHVVCAHDGADAAR